MSNLPRVFQGLPLTVQYSDGQEWLLATDLTYLTQKKRAAIHKMVASLPESERCNTTRGEQTRLGIWMATLPGVRYHRTARTRKWRLGAEVVELASRRGA